MAFSAGDHVHVRLLGKGVVREVRNGGKYLVEIKGASLVIAADQLGPIDDAKRRKREAGTSSSAVSNAAPPATTGPAAPAPTIDLHGMTAIEAEQALEQFLNDALLAGAAGARVIHGRSGGRLKAAVHARLKQLPPVRGYRIDPRNPGVTVVNF